MGKASKMKLLWAINIFWAIFLFFNAVSYSADKYWVGNNGLWDDGSQWSLVEGGAGGAGQPGAGDNAYLRQFDSINRVITYQSAVNPLIDFLRMDATGIGTITLSQSQDALSTNQERIGIDGRAIFNQGGGTNTVNQLLLLGFSTTGEGTYNFTGGDISAPGILPVEAARGEYIGYQGRGTFNHSGGTNSIARNFYFGVQPTGRGYYNLSGTGTVTANQEYIGIYGEGNFLQNGGTHTATDLYLSFFDGSKGNYDLKGGMLTVSGNEYIGAVDRGIFTQSSGTHNVLNDMYLGYAYTYGSNLRSLGIYNLQGGNLSVSDDEFIGSDGFGVFTQTGGVNTISDRLILGDNTPSTGAYGTGIYNLANGTLSSARGEIGASGTGTFNQNGGTYPISGDLYVGDQSTAAGTYNLNAGALSASSEYIGNQGIGTFNQKGGTNTIAANMTIAAISGSVGTYNLKGGTLDSGGIVNNGTLNYSGGDLNSSIINNGSMNISGGGFRIVNGDVTNNAVIKTTDTTPFFNGIFTNNGSFISDPSDNYFVDLVVGETGFLTAGLGDRFFIGRNFINHSTKNTFWDTDESSLKFTDSFLGLNFSLTHDFYLTGIDFGADITGYTNNFAWDTLSLAGGNSLRLFDGNTALGGALYINNFLLEGGLSQILDITGNGLNVYYQAGLSSNAYLAGFTYDLAGGGRLIPIGQYVDPVPEPSTLLLLGSGMLGLAGSIIRRRK